MGCPHSFFWAASQAQERGWKRIKSHFLRCILSHNSKWRSSSVEINDPLDGAPLVTQHAARCACALHLRNLRAEKMAAANSLDEILNCTVDESAISALVGSLESQLASPTSKDPAQQTSASSVHQNHVGQGSTASTTCVTGVSATGANTHAVQTSINKPLAPNIVNVQPVNSVNGSKEHTSQPQFLGINSVVNSLANSLPVQTTALVNSVSSGTSVLPTTAAAVVKSESNPTSAPKQIVVSVGSTNPVYGTPTTVTTNNASAIYNLANVASEQQPMLVPGSNIAPVSGTTTVPAKVEALQPKPDVKPPQQQVVVNVVNAPTTVQQPRPQFVLKSEKTNMGVQQQHGAVRFVTQPAQPQVQPVANIQMVPRTVVTTALKSATMTSVTTSVITITRPAAPQTVTVLRAPTATTPGNAQAAAVASSQIQFVNMPRGSQVTTGTTVTQKVLAPRVITGTPAPIRIAQQPQIVPAVRQPVWYKVDNCNMVVKLEYWEHVELSLHPASKWVAMWS